MASLASMATFTRFGREERMVLITLFVTALLTAPPALALAADTAQEIAATVPAGDKVNINTADVKALMSLDGVGRKLAEKIVEYRTAHGPFKKPEEVRKSKVS